MKRHVIFDLGNVLVDFDLRRLFRAAADNAGRPVEEMAFDDADAAMLHAVESGRISDKEFIAHLKSAKGLRWTLEDLIGVWRDMFSLNRPGFELFSGLKAQGIPVHILSNLAWHNMEAVRRNWPGMFDHGGENFFSYELGLRKPDERIYRAVLERLGAEPARCFFLDDLPENIEGARAAGMEAHLFSDEALPSVRPALEAFIAAE